MRSGEPKQTGIRIEVFRIGSTDVIAERTSKTGNTDRMHEDPVYPSGGRMIQHVVIKACSGQYAVQRAEANWNTRKGTPNRVHGCDRKRTAKTGNTDGILDDQVYPRSEY